MKVGRVLQVAADTSSQSYCGPEKAKLVSRTRCAVYIDYKAQFQEEASAGAGDRSRIVPTKKQEGKAKKPYTKYKKKGRR